VRRVAVVLGAEVGRPAGAHQHRAPGHVSTGERVEPCSTGRRPVEHHTGHRGDGVEGQVGEVPPVGEAVERGVEVGAGVADHRDRADVELGAGGIALPRRLPIQVRADGRAGQPGVGDHPVADRMAEVDRGHVPILGQ
jgi:hypothetical protein